MYTPRPRIIIKSKMKHINQVAMAAVLTLCAQNALAQRDVDSTKVRQLSEVVVKAVRAQKNAPYAVANIQKSELKNFSASGKELPFLFMRTPGILAWSEAGTGTGTTYMRMRGAAGSRINVTLDGVALNSPEDQTVFWANMNSYASLLGSVQIQRGVGSSTNGDGAFGGSISLATAAPSTKPFAELTASMGSYNTYNAGASFSTGLLWDHLIFDGAYHETGTDGFVDGTRGRSGSYYGGLTWLGDNFQIRYKNIGNFEKTGQAWNYISGPIGTESYKQIYDMGLGRSNTLLGSYVKQDDGSYKLEPYTFRDGRKWDRTTDNFYQNHNILSATWQPSEHWTHNAAIHYTYGYGYYADFRHNKSLAEKFGINEFDATTGKEIKTDAVRHKGLTQHTYGIVYNATYKNDGLEVIGGVNLQQFRGNHWGYLTYIKDELLEQKYLKNGRYTYYDSDASKNDYSAFVKASYSFLDNWNVFADLQYRHVGYKTDGLNDKFVYSDGKYYNQRLDVDDNFNFFNPKAGVSYTNGGHKAYASVALSNREPERNNYTDNGSYPFPKKEQVVDYELGYQYRGTNWHAGANLYYMDYDNQIAATGQKSDIGEDLTTNVKKSYRMGAELAAGWTPFSWISLEGNAAISQNKIKDFDEYVGDVVNHYSKSTLAYSPNAILNGFLDLRWDDLTLTWHTNFVSKQYLDNSQSRERQLPSYTQTDIHLTYMLPMPKNIGIKSIKLGLDFNNIFDRHYAAYGYDYGWYEGQKRVTSLAYIPAAGFNMMGNITLRF